MSRKDSKPIGQQLREIKADKTTAVAAAILSDEQQLRDEKVAKLKALRLAREAEGTPPAGKKEPEKG